MAVSRLVAVVLREMIATGWHDIEMDEEGHVE